MNQPPDRPPRVGDIVRLVHEVQGVECLVHRVDTPSNPEEAWEACFMNVWGTQESFFSWDEVVFLGSLARGPR